MLAERVATVEEELDRRTIAGNTARCFRAKPLNEICLDSDGFPLLVGYGEGASEEVFEATWMLPVIEPIFWPWGLPGRPEEAFTPTSFDQIQPADLLEIANEFSLFVDE